jgi:hypothetical protein
VISITPRIGGHTKEGLSRSFAIQVPGVAPDSLGKQDGFQVCEGIRIESSEAHETVQAGVLSLVHDTHPAAEFLDDPREMVCPIIGHPRL